MANPDEMHPARRVGRQVTDLLNLLDGKMQGTHLTRWSMVLEWVKSVSGNYVGFISEQWEQVYHAV